MMQHHKLGTDLSGGVKLWGLKAGERFTSINCITSEVQAVSGVRLVWADEQGLLVIIDSYQVSML